MERTSVRGPERYIVCRFGGGQIEHHAMFTYIPGTIVQTKESSI
jgi:hypothetical protein